MNRYKRQINLPQVGLKGQEKLQNTKVLVIGAGGLGSAILPYLCAAGIEKIGIIDGDKVEESNLQRQVIFTEEAVGHSKVDFASSQLKSLNSKVDIKTYDEYFSAKNALSIVDSYDIIVDATDTVSVRYLINDACVIANKPFVYGSVYRFEGQVSVFNYKNGPTYRCLFKEEEAKAINCEEAGVLGSTVGIIGMMQANEVLKIILELGTVLSGKLLLYNTLNNNQTILKFKKDESIIINAEFYKTQYLSDHIENISASAILNRNMILIDVRELDEKPIIQDSNVIQIPLSKIEKKIHNLDKHKNYAVFCQHGVRSKIATGLLKKHHFKSVKNINDGASVIKNIIENEKEKSIY